MVLAASKNTLVKKRIRDKVVEDGGWFVFGAVLLCVSAVLYFGVAVC
jgi:hypothetical protein